MKKLAVFLLCLIMAAALVGCGGEIWYNDVLDYYKMGFSTNWRNENSKWYISDEMKSGKDEYGYLLKDLDGDGTDELLIGIIDDATETRFTDIFILHRDFGPTRSFHTMGEGYYYYLCEGNLIRSDSWYGSKVETEYMKYDSENNSFPIVDLRALPQKFELQRFQ